MRVGLGFDVHRLEEGRKLVLGGVEIPFGLGLLGHSDADVLVHAVMDALLGAAGLGDIGGHFPDSDERYKGISSVLLLAEVGKRLGAKGFSVQNVDAVVIAERPRLSAYLGFMSTNIATALGINKGNVNVKATTTEGLGLTGRGEGIAAKAVVLLGIN
ncbi:MAG TPA: 2-C-methyl-D-erythritol 2,4-cyclodiphosphate synthase [Clostridia bacterium]|nr:2-C-methyl-D-erythritol 2,4-cyclodiphosphate synthase [Clostridia bacterium]